MLKDKLNKKVNCGIRHRKASFNMLDLSFVMADVLVVLISRHVLRTSFSLVIMLGMSLLE